MMMMGGYLRDVGGGRASMLSLVPSSPTWAPHPSLCTTAASTPPPASYDSRPSTPLSEPRRGQGEGRRAGGWRRSRGTAGRRVLCGDSACGGGAFDGWRSGGCYEGERSPWRRRRGWSGICLGGSVVESQISCLVRTVRSGMVMSWRLGGLVDRVDRTMLEISC
jgi:hypothetical protein